VDQGLERAMEIKGSKSAQASRGASALEGVQFPSPAGAVDLKGIPDVSLADVHACIGRSKKAAAVHDDILRRVADGSARLGKGDIEAMLARAGVEKTDVKTVLAYHARHSARAFDDGALKFLAAMDWSDVAAAGVEELKRQNKEQVESHRQFIKDDKREFDALKSDDLKTLQKKADEKQKLQKKSAFEADADFAEEITKSGITDPKQAALLHMHRKGFTKS
jgi:hypothetical protein